MFLFFQALRPLLTRPVAVFKIFVILALANLLVGALLGVSLDVTQLPSALARYIAGQRETVLPPGVGLTEIVVFLVLQSVLMLWATVGWHRYMLLDEEPVTLPVPHPIRMLDYFVKGALIAVVLGALGLGLLLAEVYLTGILAEHRGTRGGPNLMPLLILLELARTVIVILLGLRLATALPGVALRPGVSIFTGLRATAGESGTLIAILFFLLLGGWLEGWLAQGIAEAFGPHARATANDLFRALNVFVWISLLTTLYGHYVEGRPVE